MKNVKPHQDQNQKAEQNNEVLTAIHNAVSRYGTPCDIYVDSGCKTREGYTDQHFEFVREIIRRSEETAPVELSFGYYSLDGQHEDGILLKNAPHKVIERVIELKQAGMKNMLISLKYDGLHIDFYNSCSTGKMVNDLFSYGSSPEELKNAIQKVRSNEND